MGPHPIADTLIVLGVVAYCVVATYYGIKFARWATDKATTWLDRR